MVAAGEAIRLVNLRKRYGAVEAVRGVTLDVRDGEFLALIGPSGCGKTTTLRMVAGLETPSSGEVLIHGQSMAGVKPWQRQTPLVWQNSVLFPHLTVARNVEFGLRMQRVAKEQRRERVQQALATVGLEDLADRLPSQLSGGQKQRVGLARALVLNPRVLLLDEPLGALDAKIARTMQVELRRLHQELGITFLYVTHNQSEALAMADRVAVMDSGVLQQVGTPHQVFREPRTRFVAEFVGANNIFTGQVQATGAEEAEIATPQGLFLVRQPVGRPLAPGATATFIVGADRLRIAGVAESAPNRLAGIVTAVEYVGSVVTAYLTLPDDTEVRLQAPESAVGALPPGARLAIAWAAADAFVLPEP